eukprot:Gregarina_sp_Poly_1__790@NODE_118_length_13642_cov_140_527956_g105_i0_p6_GENE_NODE_118_length_13642_cov_140_527956_g105_i0NODE_118_length_13642_cov_140_527956_g105_i0_p6_ORF_typecomplete_len195_score22_27_NODE_118_length_13642_cov_140_527956_g105_i085599143
MSQPTEQSESRTPVKSDPDHGQQRWRLLPKSDEPPKSIPHNNTANVHVSQRTSFPTDSHRKSDQRHLEPQRYPEPQRYLEQRHSEQRHLEQRHSLSPPHFPPACSKHGALQPETHKLIDGQIPAPDFVGMNLNEGNWESLVDDKILKGNGSGIFRSEVEVPRWELEVVPRYVDVPIRIQKIVRRKKIIKKFVKK